MSTCCQQSIDSADQNKTKHQEPFRSIWCTRTCHRRPKLAQARQNGADRGCRSYPRRLSSCTFIELQLSLAASSITNTGKAQSELQSPLGKALSSSAFTAHTTKELGHEYQSPNTLGIDVHCSYSCAHYFGTGEGHHEWICNVEHAWRILHWNQRTGRRKGHFLRFLRDVQITIYARDQRIAIIR